jgi:hypothetical protein
MLLECKDFRAGMPNNKATELREQAERCRRLARETTNTEVAERLTNLANDLERQAAEEEAPNPC